LFAHEREADSIEHAQSLSRTRFFWWVSYLCDYSSWDWFYEPPPWQAHQNHVWPSKWHQYSGTCLISKDPTDQWNFHNEVIATRCVDENWHVLYPVNQTQFDFSWHPHPLDPPYIYVWGNQHWPAEQMPTVEYHVPGAIERKYMDWPASLLPTATNWTTPAEIDPVSVDYSWVPDPQDPPYIYEFATQWQPNGGAVYTVPGATERKYVEYQHRKLSDSTQWIIPALVDTNSVDTSWHPSNTEQPYIYEFATQWQSNGGAVYTVPGATERKYVEIQHRRLPDNQAFTKLEVVQGFDYSWHPDNTEESYDYVFGNQHWPGTEMPTLVYKMSNATQEKFVDGVVARLDGNMGNWELHEEIDQDTWDWSWVPNPKDPPYTYVFGNQWNLPEFKASVTYHVPGATDIKYMDRRTTRLPQPAQFRHNIAVSKFDYSWEPNPFDPPMTYVFGNQWNSAVLEPTVIYSTGGTEIKYVDDIIATVAQDVTAWELLDNIEEFDYSWRPNPTDPPYIYVFGNQWLTPEQRPALQYAVPSATQIKYMDHPRAQRRRDHTRFTQHYPADFDWSWEPEPGSPPYIYVFGNQWWPAEKMPTVEYHMPGATERKYMPSPVAQLLVDMSKWTIPEHVDTTDMDFSWMPDPGEPPYIYQFATQHQKTGGPQYRMPGATEFKYVDMMRAEVKKEAAPIFEIDHLDGNAGNIEGVVRKVRYFDNYRDTLIRLAKSLVGQYEHVWICSSICDYSNFDFTWHPETWQSTMLHVFASDKEKFGDTFYMHVPTFAERAEKKALLEWYSVNYVPRKNVPRRPMPVIHHTGDSHVDAVKTTTWPGPLATFTTTDSAPTNTVTVPLWRKETKAIVPLSAGATSVVVPRVAVGDIRTQLYDYAYIDKTHRTVKDYPLDIVFISNGEPYAEFNYEHLKWAVQMEGLDCNHIHHSKGVNGRVAAYQAAARLSTTPWFFAVFAKLEVDHRFDWYWQPDRMQQPKHYIFHAHNPVNGLVYGHQAMIAYNKQMTLENTGGGLDFTMDQPHEVVPIISGTANYTESPWMAWRTAFREVLKLKHSLPDVENEYRLNMWLSNAGEVKNAEWSQFGAEDAVEYYNEVGGDFAALKKSYEWEWLASYAFMRRSLAPDR